MAPLGGGRSAFREEIHRLGRLGLGLGLLLGGGTLVALGLIDGLPAIGTAVGLSPPIADRLALGLALLVLPGTLFAVRHSLAGTAGGVPLRAGGIIVGLSITLAIALPAAGPTQGLTVPLFGYVLGLLLLLAGVLAGPLADSAVDTADDPVAFERSTQNTPGVTPADGGTEEDDDLEFLLDDEDR